VTTGREIQAGVRVWQSCWTIVGWQIRRRVWQMAATVAS
jgi:hypothetical protein